MEKDTSLDSHPPVGMEIFINSIFSTLTFDDFSKRLSEKGVENMIVVEGGDRVGGRVKDVTFGDVNVEVSCESDSRNNRPWSLSQ